MDWLIEDISNILKSWGHTGGKGGELIAKVGRRASDGGSQKRGNEGPRGIMIPENLAKRSENGKRWENCGKQAGKKVGKVGNRWENVGTGGNM